MPLQPLQRNTHASNTLHKHQQRKQSTGDVLLTYFQVSNLKRPDLLLVLHVPDLNETAHITRHHQLGVGAERSTCDRILVTCSESDRTRFVLMDTEHINDESLLQTCAFKQHVSIRHAPHEGPVVLSAGDSQTVAHGVQTNTKDRTCESKTASSKIS